MCASYAFVVFLSVLYLVRGTFFCHQIVSLLRGRNSTRTISFVLNARLFAFFFRHLVLVNRFTTIPCPSIHIYAHWVVACEKAAVETGAMHVVVAGSAADDLKASTEAALLKTAASGKQDKRTGDWNGALQIAAGKRLAPGKVAEEWAANEKASSMQATLEEKGAEAAEATKVAAEAAAVDKKSVGKKAAPDKKGAGKALTGY